MPLSKSKGNMYDWTTHTHTHLRGECPHKCSYCYVQAMERRFGGGHYAGELRLKESEFAVQYGKGKTIFMEHCNDLFASKVPRDWIYRILDHCRAYPDNTYIFQTKNPGRYTKFLEVGMLPPKRVLGCTIESAYEYYLAHVSKAPSPINRAAAMADLRTRGERTFITIEPILAGDVTDLANMIKMIEPEFVNIGADSKGAGLDEPSAEDVRMLISLLQASGVEIREKHNLDRLLR